MYEFTLIPVLLYETDNAIGYLRGYYANVIDPETTQTLQPSLYVVSSKKLLIKLKTTS